MTDFLSIETYDADAGDPGAMDRLRGGETGAIVLRGVYPQAALAALPPRLEANAPGFVKTTFPPAFHAYFYGINLNLAAADLDPYFAAEPAFRERLAALDLGGAPLEERVCGLLSQLDNGRPYAAAPGPQAGERHFFTTIRAHETGGYIPPHFDNEAALRPTYRHIARLCEPEIYSFVLCLDQAEAGGALEVYDLTSEQHRDLRNLDGSRKPDLSQVAKTSIRLAPGEMVVLHSSRYLHGVQRVEGARTRWTVCSFMARARDGDAVYAWG